MKKMKMTLLVLLGMFSMWGPVAHGDAQNQGKPTVEIPQPGVPERLAIEGKFVRAAYNNEGYVILGYQASNRSIGEDWMLLEVGIALRDRVPDQTMLRSAIS